MSTWALYVLWSLIILALWALGTTVWSIITERNRRRAEAALERLGAELQTAVEERVRSETERDTIKAQLQARDAAESEATLEREKDRQAMINQLGERFQTMAGKALEQKREAIQGAGELAIKRLIDPLQSDIKAFREKIEHNQGQASTERTELKTLVNQLHQANINIGDEARQLTQALKGESQTRGYWGEMILQKLLENAGLVQGQHYIAQQTFRSEQNQSKRPDVVLKLPGERYVVIDAKVSLNAYERAVGAKEADEREQEIKAHVKAVETHIKQLSAKNYQEIEELEGKNLEFVFMFVPLEAAYIAAYQAQPKLLEQSRVGKVALLSPATLLPVLLMVAGMWRIDQRNRNVEQLSKLAGDMYDKFVNFVASYEGVGQALNKAQQAWEGGRSQLSEGRGNLVRRAEKIRNLGISPKKSLPKNYLDSLELEALEEIDEGLAESAESIGKPPVGIVETTDAQN